LHIEKLKCKHVFCPGLPVSGTEGVEYLAKYTMLLNAYLFPKDVCIDKPLKGGVRGESLRMSTTN